MVKKFVTLFVCHILRPVAIWAEITVQREPATCAQLLSSNPAHSFFLAERLFLPMGHEGLSRMQHVAHQSHFYIPDSWKYTNGYRVVLHGLVYAFIGCYFYQRYAKRKIAVMDDFFDQIDSDEYQSRRRENYLEWKNSARGQTFLANLKEQRPSEEY